MPQLDLLGYPAIAVNHYDRKAAPVASSIEQAASSIEQAADMAAEHFGNEAIIIGWCYDVLVFTSETDEDVYYIKIE